MSLILDALKRAERERRAGQTPMPLDSIAIPQPETPRIGAHRWLLPALVGAAVAGGGVYLWVALRSPAPSTAAAAAPIAVAAAAPATAIGAAPPATDTTPAAAAVTDDSLPASPPPAINNAGPATLDDLVDDKPTAGSRGDARPAPGLSPPDEGSGSPRESGAARRANPDAIAERAPPEPLPPFEQPVGPPPVDAAPSTPTTTPAPAASLPTTNVPAAPVVDPLTAAQATGAAPPTTAARSFREMSPNYRAEFPSLSIDVHVYDSDPQRRFVILNGKRYHEGETIAEGPRIVGIIADGIVFDYRGERVMYGLTR